MRRLVVIGLDCAPPSLTFDTLAHVMPNLTRLRERAIWGPLRSSRPPITVPAWTCMVSGRDPGELGLYGFRTRVPGTYESRVNTARDVHVKRVWDWAGEQGRRVAALFVPLTFPATPVRGSMVSGFLRTDDGSPWCFPRALEKSLTAEFGPYLADVEDFRTDDLDRIWSDLDAMLTQHFAIARHTWITQQPDFLMMVEIGVDRFHHAFWHHFDPLHHAHVPNNPWADAHERYYARVDSELGALIDILDDDVDVMVVSDHGAQAMHRGFHVNQWLIDQGYLVLGDDHPMGKLDLTRVDWSRTRAWGEGGYCARIYLNVAGREPCGIVPAYERDTVAAELSAMLTQVRDDNNDLMLTSIDQPTTAYRTARGAAPDLVVYLDDLRTRALGTIGAESWFVVRNDTGADTCNHAWDGIVLWHSATHSHALELESASIYDVAPTISEILGVTPPPDLQGVSLLLRSACT